MFVKRLSVVQATPGTAPQTPDRDRRRAPLSPVVRRLRDQHGIDPTSLRGSGSEGHITRSDVEAAIVQQGDRDASIKGDEVIPFTRIRRITAEHMVRSKATSAHTLMVKEVDYERVEAIRRAYGPSFKEREGFTLT
jgi:2-oxoglutarate dehydrogenase E2 component (dihydrolipoamide succinyltransferase)